jgi:hypothetical protein
MSVELQRLTGLAQEKPLNRTTFFAYQVPSFLTFHHQVLKELLAILTAHTFTIEEDGSIKMPPLLKMLDLRIAKTTYRIGAGGLHSNEATSIHKAEDGTAAVRSRRSELLPCHYS